MTLTKVAIIGSNGFIGRNLSKRLLQIPGIELSLFGKNEKSVIGDGRHYRKIDISDEVQVKNFLAGTEVVYFLASETIPASTWDEPIAEIEKNLVPFLKFLEVIAKLGIKKVVYTSSAGTIYGVTDQKVSEDSYKNPYSPYGIIKLASEYFLNYYKSKYNVAFDIFRVSNVYGPGQNTKKGLGIINTFLEKIVAENKIQIFGDGNNIRNYLYIEDLAELLTLPLFSDPEQSGIFNTSSNDTISINGLVSILKRVITEKFEVVHTATRKSDNPAIYIDNTKLLEAFPGFKFTSINEGILKTYNFIKNNQ